MGRYNFNPQATGLGNQQSNLVGVALFHTQQRRHVFDGVVCFEECRLNSDDGIVGSVRLVKAVPGKVLNVAKDRFRRFQGDPIIDTAIEKLGAVGQQRFLVLFAYGLADRVCLARLVAGKLRGDLDDSAPGRR